MAALMSSALAWLQTPLTTPSPTNISARCSADILPYPKVFGAEVLSLSAQKVLDFSSANIQASEALPKSSETALDFCNVTVTYTHPGQNDIINVHIWLPLKDWNGRFLGAGGGGWVTGFPMLGPAIELGYAAASTDGGHPASRSAASWAQTSPGNVNWGLLQDFAARALDDMTVMGKAVTTSFYETAPKYSYWNGCSTGGRQGLMMAQRFPRYYDGILAKAPAINWATFVVSEFWPQQVMNRLGVYPTACELDAFTAAAIEACDELDGLADGIIGAPGLCHFDPHTVVDRTFQCNGIEEQFTSAGATVAQAAWTGPIGADGQPKWFGVNKDASLTALAGTATTADGNRKGNPFLIADEWIRLFVVKDPDYNTANMTDEQYFSVLKSSQQQYESILSTNWPDLSDFRHAGGKIITWHGLADNLIAPNGTRHYYERVLELDAKAADFYRYFEAPGVGHCAGGSGPVPKDPLGALVRWVEQGIAPDALEAVGQKGAEVVRQLCAYPLVQRYRGGDPTVASSFECADGFV